MLHVPGVDRLRLGFHRAAREQRVIDRAARYTGSSRTFQRRRIFVFVQGNERQPLASILYAPGEIALALLHGLEGGQLGAAALRLEPATDALFLDHHGE